MLEQTIFFMCHMLTRRLSITGIKQMLPKFSRHNFLFEKEAENVYVIFVIYNSLSNNM